MILIFAAMFPASASASDAFQTIYTQSAQAQIDAFDGTWVGSGSNARTIFRTRCGDGPLVEMKIQKGAAKAILKTFAKGRARSGLLSRVIPLSGIINSDGKLELTGYESSATVDLSASDGLGEGTWEFRKLACHGSFRVQLPR